MQNPNFGLKKVDFVVQILQQTDGSFLILTIMRKKNSPYYNKKRSLSPSLMNLFITFLKDRWLKLNATSWKGCPLKDTGISAQILLKGVSKLIQTMFLEFIQTGNKLTLHLKIMQSN